MKCQECELYKYSEPSCLYGIGNKKADIMIINSYAKDEDEAQGHAVIPPHLANYLKKIGIEKDFYYTNAIKCRAPQKYKYKVSEIKRCYKAHLSKEIEQVNPKYILLIGAQALKATIGGAITTHNGVTIKHEGRKYMATYSPAIIYRDPSKTQYVDQAFQNFKNLIAGKERKLPKLDIRIVKSTQDIEKSLKYLKRHNFNAISYDIETTGLNRFENDITLFGYGNNKVQFIIPLQVRFSPLRNRPILQRKLMRYAVKRLNDENFIKIAGNGKFDDLFLLHHFGRKPELTFDVVLASHLLNENTKNGVKENAVLHCNALDWDIDLSLKKGNLKTHQDYDNYITYLGYDIYYEYSLYKVFRPQICDSDTMYNLFYHLYMPGILAYEEVEQNGVYVYTKKFKKVRAYLEKKLSKSINDLNKCLKSHISKKQLNKLAEKFERSNKGLDHKINWASDTQIREILFNVLELPVIEKTEAGNPSVSEASLKQLQDKHEIVELILAYRGIAIQISHFIDGWINRMHGGKLYPSFKLHGTVTGRTSCTDPNLQQVPRDPTIRSLIGAPDGWSFIEADFSQAELRIASMSANDSAMKMIYQTGGDIHSETYKIVSGEEVSDDKYVRKEQRKKAKAVNFGFLYGMGWRKFKEYARDNYGIKLTESEAKEYRVRFFEVYKDLPRWHDRQRMIVKSLGEVTSPIGRVRRLPDINSSDRSKRAEAERQSINSPVQGFGSDLTILGMIEAMGYAHYYDESLVIDKSKAKCVGTVHDATLFMVKNSYLMKFIPRVKAIMESPVSLKKIFNYEHTVPMIVDIAVGNAWSQGKELDMSNDDWKDDVKEVIRKG